MPDSFPQFAIIVAGGSGTRMGTEVPKQFLLLAGKPVLQHTLERFTQAMPEVQPVVVLPDAQRARWESLCESGKMPPHQVVTGGATRFESVRNGLAVLPEGEALVAVHDGVRPLVPVAVIRDAFKIAGAAGAAVTAVAVKDSVRQLLSEGKSQVIDRSKLLLVQTPQCFQLQLLRSAYAQATHTEFTDDASVAEAAGFPVQIVTGSYRNIKITTPEDLAIAETLLKQERGEE